MAAKWDEFQMTAFWTCIHGATVRRVATVNHFSNILYLRSTGVKSIQYFLIVICKNLLENIHRIIMMQQMAKENPLPLKIEGQGS